MDCFKITAIHFLLLLMSITCYGHESPMHMHDGGIKKHHKQQSASPTTCHIESGQTANCVFNKVACDTKIKFRSITGLCNNLEHPEYGSAYSLFKRILPSTYNGGGEPKGGNPSSLPSARLVSREVHDTMEILDDQNSHMHMLFGQFLDHDFTFTPMTATKANCSVCNSPDPACFPIPISVGDPVFPDGTCMEFIRSSNGKLNPNDEREQINQITSFIDASNVYGSEVALSRQLRSFVGGKLKVGDNDMLPVTRDQKDCNETQLSEDQGCFLAGDKRNSVINGLASLHTLWVREHNKIAETLSGLAPAWDDEKLYLVTRKIVGAIMQRITYSEYLPPSIGNTIMEEMGILEEPNDEYFHDYDPKCDAAVTNEFATAGFRFGHSQIHSAMAVYKQNGPVLTTEVHSLDGNWFNPHYLYQDPDNINGMLHGASVTPGQKFDVNYDEIVRDHIFKGPDLGKDLAALNIQRERDHGIPGYTYYRFYYGLSPVNEWNDLVSVVGDETVVNKMKSVYGSSNEHVHDVDLVVGIFAEMSANNMNEGLLGGVGRKMLAEEFRKLKYCDRFFYSSDHADHTGKFTPEQLIEIRKMKLSTVMCNHLDEHAELPEHGMLLSGIKKPCSELKKDYMDLSKFVNSEPEPAACFQSRMVPLQCTPESENPLLPPDYGVRIGGDDCEHPHDTLKMHKHESVNVKVKVESFNFK